MKDIRIKLTQPFNDQEDLEKKTITQINRRKV